MTTQQNSMGHNNSLEWREVSMPQKLSRALEIVVFAMN
jgi:hypothetical protein